MNNGIFTARKIKGAVLNIRAYMPYASGNYRIYSYSRYSEYILEVPIIKAELNKRYNRNTAEHLEHTLHNTDNACYCTSDRSRRGGVSQ